MLPGLKLLQRLPDGPHKLAIEYSGSSDYCGQDNEICGSAYHVASANSAASLMNLLDRTARDDYFKTDSGAKCSKTLPLTLILLFLQCHDPNIIA